MRKILVPNPDYKTYCSKAGKLLETHDYELIINQYGRPFDFLKYMDLLPEIDGVIAGIEKWDEAMYRIAKRLKIIARFGVGVDNIDLVKARKYGISVTNAPKANSNAVAEFTVGLILDILRKTSFLSGMLRSGKWHKPLGHEMKAKKVGLIGFGAIAQLVAKKLAGFETILYAYDVFPNFDKAREYNVRLVSLPEVIAECDIISLHLPSTAETYHIIDSRQIAEMKKGAYLINTARGDLIAEDALFTALQSGKLDGAAIDVYHQEPVDFNHPLFKLDNLICTPHIGGDTVESVETVGLTTARAVLDVFAGKSPANLLN
jgi:D-3-phosphoglycerate dehydrogenase